MTLPTIVTRTRSLPVDPTTVFRNPSDNAVFLVPEDEDQSGTAAVLNFQKITREDGDFEERTSRRALIAWLDQSAIRMKATLHKTRAWADQTEERERPWLVTAVSGTLGLILTALLLLQAFGALKPSNPLQAETITPGLEDFEQEEHDHSLADNPFLEDPRQRTLPPAPRFNPPRRMVELAQQEPLETFGSDPPPPTYAEPAPFELPEEPVQSPPEFEIPENPRPLYPRNPPPQTEFEIFPNEEPVGPPPTFEIPPDNPPLEPTYNEPPAFEFNPQQPIGPPQQFDPPEFEVVPPAYPPLEEPYPLEEEDPYFEQPPVNPPVQQPDPEPLPEVIPYPEPPVRQPDPLPTGDPLDNLFPNIDPLPQEEPQPQPPVEPIPEPVQEVQIPEDQIPQEPVDLPDLRISVLDLDPPAGFDSELYFLQAQYLFQVQSELFIFGDDGSDFVAIISRRDPLLNPDELWNPVDPRRGTLNRPVSRQILKTERIPQSLDVSFKTLINSPHFRFEMTGPPRANVGETLSFRFRVTNTGPVEARGTVFQADLPKHLQHTRGKILDYQIGTLAPGETHEAVMHVKAISSGHVEFRVAVTDDGSTLEEQRQVLSIDSTPVQDSPDPVAPLNSLSEGVVPAKPAPARRLTSPYFIPYPQCQCRF